ncbi:MAG: FlgD immunoglobulin-like domain containing protein [Candidatus Cloacimonadales bacterium]|nr:FlgD immunoglobulin-like domain containing protein [Candidatus Cloacimonadales bacterium]
MRKLFVLFILVTLHLSASVVQFSELPADIQSRVVPDMEGRVLLNDLDAQLMEEIALTRDLPTVVTGWPVSYTGANCHNGAIYVNMDADPDMEILFGVGTKITALNLDGTSVPGWPKQLGFYIWSSPACGDIDGDGAIEIVCTSRNNSTANSGELYAFELDGTPCTGFPVIQAGGGTNNVCLYDLDDNGDMEILVNVRNNPQGWVYVYDGDGTVFPGFPQELDYIPGAGISAGDITGDGIPEIIALSYHKIHVFDLQGNILPGFPLENVGYNYSYSQPILFDLDDDGLNEIIWGGCASSTGAVFAVNQDASSVTGWPQATNYWIFGTVSIGDVDQDGSMDVVIGDQVSSGTPVDQIFAWNAAGNALPGFPAGPTNAIYAQIGIADLDGDGFVELMIDDNNFTLGYNCYNHDGTHCTEWPLPCGTIWSSTTMQITPVFGDVDNDNQIEIMGAATDIMGWVVECYLWDTGTAWNEDLAYMIVDGCNMQHNGLYEESVPATFDPPTNLFVDDLGYATWDAPGGGGGNVVVLNQQPNQSNGVFSDYSYPQIIADNFLLNTDTTVEQLVVWGGYYSGNVPMEPDYFTVIFHDDAAGSPGTVLFTEANVPYEREQTGIVLFGVNEWMHTLTLTTPVTLAAGTYWLEFYNTTGYPATDTYFWEVGNLDPVAGVVGSAYSLTVPVTGWSLDPATDLAFQLISSADRENFSIKTPIKIHVNNSVMTNSKKATIVGRDMHAKMISQISREPNIREKSRTLVGYNVWLDGVFIAYTTDEFYQYTGLTLNQVYTAGVSAVYDDPGESEIMEVSFTYSPINFEPPQNLEVDHYYSFPNNIYDLTWDEPNYCIPNLVNYNIYVNDEVYATVSANITELTITNAPINANAESTFYITALYEDPVGESIPSNSVTCVAMSSAEDIMPYNALFCNYPNPFNPTTTIKFGLCEDLNVVIDVYNIKGEKVRTLVNGELEAGYHSILWNGKDDSGKNTASGVYFYKMKAGKFVSTKKMILMK